eukprot:Skav206603  [mRNA]  locus=scaffold332:65022:80299:- [translate_table: standard]
MSSSRTSRPAAWQSSSADRPRALVLGGVPWEALVVGVPWDGRMLQGGHVTKWIGNLAKDVRCVQRAMGGSMSLTGEPDGAPMKTGLSLFDLTAGLHGVIGILAALNNKHNTGLGQHVDISMLDVAVALLANQGMNYLAKKQRQKRVGNNHPNVVPYQVMPAKDGYFILTASNNDQFERFCKVAGRMDLMQDERFNTMKARVVNREVVTPTLNEITSQHEKLWWLEKLEGEMVGCAPILHLDEVFADPHVQSREMEIQMNLPGFEEPVSLIGSPMKFSRTKVDYRLPPPRVGEHTEQVLLEYGMSKDQIEDLHEIGAIDNAKFEVPGVVRPLARKKRRVVEVSDSHGAPYVFQGNTWGHISSVSDPRIAVGIDNVEDEDLTELDTFGGVLRSSIDDPINAFLKARKQRVRPRASRAFARAAGAEAAGDWLVGCWCEEVLMTQTWESRHVPNRWLGEPLSNQRLRPLVG